MNEHEDALQFAGDYRLREVLIKSSRNIELDFRSLVLEMNIFEDIFSNSMYGNIIIRDSANHIENLPIIGQEDIRFKFETPGYSDPIDFEEYPMKIYKVDKQTRTLEREQVYMLHFTTKEALTNLRTRTSHAYTDTTSNSVKKILKNIVKTNKPIFIEPSSGIHKIVSPNYKPFELIKLMAKRSESLNHNIPGYLFFENHRGYHFRSLESLSYFYNEPREPKYAFFDRTMKRDNNIKNVDLDLSTIKEFKILRVNDMMADTMTGMLSSTHYTHDIHTKTWTKTEYNYFNEFDKTLHVDEKEKSKQNFGPFYSKTPITQDGKTVADFSRSKIFVSPRATKLHSQSDSDPRTYDNRSNIWFQSMRSNRLAYDQLKLQLTLYGNTAIAAGDLVYISVPSIEPLDERSDIVEDQLYSGRYIVSSVRHIIANTSHDMIIECIKDDFYTKLSELDVPTEYEQKDRFKSIREIDVNSGEDYK